MPTTRNTGAAAAFMEVLVSDLASLEREACEVRALLEGLRAYAGMANGSATSPGEAAVPSSARTSLVPRASEPVTGDVAADVEPRRPGIARQGKFPQHTAKGKALDKVAKVVGKGKGKGTSVGGSLLEPPTEDVATLAELGVGKGAGKGSSSGGAKSEPPGKDAATLAELGVSKKQAKRNDDKTLAAELSKVAGTISDAAAQEAAAARAKEVEKLADIVAVRCRAERRAGELLAAMNGRVRLPPAITKAQSKKYRRDAELTAEEFEAKLGRSQRRAVAAIGEVSGGAKSEPPDKSDATLAEPGVGRQAKPDDKAAAAELRKVAATIAKASAAAGSAKRDGAFEKLMAEVEREKRAERRAGEILAHMRRAPRMMPGTSGARVRWRRFAQTPAAAFEEIVRAAQRRALAVVGAPTAMLVAIATPAQAARPQHVKDRPSHAAPPRPKMKLTPFEEAPDGTLTRFLTAEVEDGGAEAAV